VRIGSSGTGLDDLAVLDRQTIRRPAARIPGQAGVPAGFRQDRVSRLLATTGCVGDRVAVQIERDLVCLHTETGTRRRDIVFQTIRGPLICEGAARLQRARVWWSVGSGDFFVGADVRKPEVQTWERFRAWTRSGRGLIEKEKGEDAAAQLGEQRVSLDGSR